jgi:uncharacterized protein (DUF58 family)
MFWTVLIPHLTVSAVVLGLLLRALWRYDRRVAATIADLADEDAVSQRQFDEIRAEVKAAMRARVDRAIEQMRIPFDPAPVEFRALTTSRDDHPADPDTDAPISPRTQSLPH